MEKLSGKQRRFLRAIGNEIKPTVFVGKDGICEPLIESLKESFNNNEVVKIRIEKRCNLEKKDIAERLATAIGGHAVQIIGNIILLYLPNIDKPIINLPS